MTGLFHQLPYLQLSLFTGNLPTLNLNLPFPHLLISINTNSDPTPNNPSENSNSPYIPVTSTPSIDLNNSTILSVPVVDSLKSNHISTPSLTKSA